jgi:hypothetical protein
LKLNIIFDKIIITINVTIVLINDIMATNIQQNSSLIIITPIERVYSEGALIDLLKKLETDPADPNIAIALEFLKNKPSLQASLFRKCCRDKHEKILEKLIEMDCFGGNDLDSEGFSAIHHLVHCGLTSALERLLDKFPGIVNTPNRHGHPPLIHACAKDRKEASLLLIDRGADLNLKSVTILGKLIAHNQHDLINSILFLVKSKKITVEIDGFLVRYLTLADPLKQSFEKLGCQEDLLHLKTMGHIWGLDGPFQTGLLKATFSRYHIDFILPELIKFQKTFLSSQPSSELIEAVSKCLDAIQKMKDLTPLDIAKKIAAGETVVLPAGWAGHITFLVFSKGKLYKCNRGEGCGSFAGIIRYPIDKSKMQPLLLSPLISRIRSTLYLLEGKHVFDKEINNTLGLYRSEYLSQKKQKSGNCTKASYSAAFLALLWDRADRLYSTAPVAKEKALEMYKTYSRWVREASLEQHLARPEKNKDLLLGVRSKLIGPTASGVFKADHDDTRNAMVKKIDAALKDNFNITL